MKVKINETINGKKNWKMCTKISLSQGDSQYGVYSFPVVTDSTPETGVVPRRGGGGG